MFKWYKLSLGLLVVGAVLIFGGIKPAQAEEVTCFCYSNLDKLIADKNIVTLKNDDVLYHDCAVSEVGCKDEPREINKDFPGKYVELVCDEAAYEPKACEKAKTGWEDHRARALEQLANFEEAHGFFGTVIPKCLLQDELTPACKNVTVFVELFINLAKYLFGIVGALALAYFIYGGFVLILSQGNAEKIKSGTDAMLAAAIGLVIVFGAYLLIQFLGISIGLESGYNLL